MSRLELCQKLIEEARKCLENNDKECVMRKIEKLVRSNCHNGNAVGREIANKVKGVFHELWLVSDNELICKLLSMLRSLGISKNWVKKALGLNSKDLNKRLAKCGIDWESRATRNNVVRQLEDLLRRLGWSEVRMCEELWRFVGVDVNALRRYGIEPCAWLSGLELLSDLRRPYWLGLKASDLAVEGLDDKIRLELNTTNSVDAVFFPKILSVIKAPSLTIKLGERKPVMKYVSGSIIYLSFYVNLGIGDWPWPIELSADELKRILDSFIDEELSMFVAGLIDGDGTIQYVKTQNNKEKVFVLITACKNCPKRFILDVLKDVIAERFGILGNIVESYGTIDALVFRGEKAIRLLRLIRPFVHHPLRRLRIELILALYDGRISREAFEKLYEMTEYEYGGPDVKRNHGLEALARAAPQTHTHGGTKHEIESMVD
jgi:hypothetical protein